MQADTLERGCLSGSVSLVAGIEVPSPRPLIPLIQSLKTSEPPSSIRRHEGSVLHAVVFRKCPAAFHPWQS